MSGSIARRYAKAILAVAHDENQLEKAGDELLALAGVTSAPTVAAALANPILSEGKRRDLATAIARDLAVGPTMLNFVRLLADRQRLDQIAAIAVQYRRLLDEKLGRVRAVITSATALDASELDRILAVFEKKTGKKVLAETVVDESQLGGVIVDIEGKVFDGSLRNQLKTLAASIAGSQSYI
jgi:F-type H+-transporting ATPase subunit delta